MWSNVHPEEAAKRLFSRLKQVGECVEWQGYCNPKGYGHICIQGKTHYTHRVMLELKLKRRLETHEVVCHAKECSNPRCCNPDHLRVGDLMENVRDRVEVARPRRRVRASRLLTTKEVLIIRLRLRCNHSVYKIAESTGRGETTIRDIRDGRTWRDIKLPQKAA